MVRERHTHIFNNHGAALVELALIVLLLLLLVFTFTELGMAIRRSNVIVEAARAGARAAAAKSGQDPANLCLGSMVGINAICDISVPPADQTAASGFHGACNYLRSEGFDEQEWRVIVGIETRVEDGATFPMIRLVVEQADPNKKNCMICLGGFMDDFRIASPAVFAVQRNCT